MTAALLAILSEAREALKEFVNNLLLVAGGFLIGYLLGGVVGWALGKYVFRQKEPDLLHRASRIIGGATLALIVALIVFTGRGRPFGEGGDGRGSPANDAVPANTTPSNPDPSPKVEPSKITPPPKITPGDVTIRVTVLGGEDVLNDRYYLIDDDHSPKTFAELKAAVLDRKSKEPGKVMVAILFPARNALPRESLAVTQVSKWVNEEAKLDVIFPSNR
jgi:amino acid transporter